MQEIERQLRGYRLTTAEILYGMPDYPEIVQSFVWQFMDLAPDYPKLTNFLSFWETNIEGPIKSVNVAGRSLVTPAEIRHFMAGGHLH